MWRDVVGAQSAQVHMTPVGQGFAWNSFNEETAAYDDNSITTVGLMEQLNTTRDASDYLWYHVPRSWLKPTGNLMVVFEEVGGNPHGISLVKRTVQSVCADIYEWQPTLMNYMMQSSGKVDRPLRPKAHLLCAPGQKISSIKFASFGTPQGACGSFSEEVVMLTNHTTYLRSLTQGTLMQTCIGQQACTVDVTPEVFGGDPCPKVMKKLSVEAICS
ncbi:hypothetical protein Syun_026327 [Stephania yunnanensis]|uniref:SUEL-type lectin domain-containing protein n=1 Tax=Stephania yunnanensis TaxID=152371 RepID=A0AAP0HVM5_9MAGN